LVRQRAQDIERRAVEAYDEYFMLIAGHDEIPVLPSANLAGAQSNCKTTR
jgi:hypothetical protein